MSAAAAPRFRRCRDGFLISEGLCVVPGCEANGYDTRPRTPRPASSCHANGRTARIMAQISNEWAPFKYTGDTAERNRDWTRISRLVECRKLQRRPGTGGRVEYRRDV